VRITSGAQVIDSAKKTRPTVSIRWWHIVILVVALLATFLLGTLFYRSGAVHPVAAFLRTFLSQGFLSQQMPAPVKEAALDIQDEIRMYENNGLPTLYIDLPFKSYQQLLEKRNEALKIGVLNTTDADFVKGEVQLQDGPKLDAKFRLKGDWTDHLEGEKWSFRINLQEEGQILGTRQFSIETPSSRNFLYEWAFHKNLQKEGLLTTRYEFVNVLLNGKLLGIYAFEENFAPEMIESQGRRQGVIIRFNEDPLWNNISVFWGNGITQSEGGNLSITSMDSAEISTYQESRIAADPTLSAEAQAARDMLRAFQEGIRPASEVLDVEQTGLFFALHDLWSAEHGVAWHNLRFYYNPVTSRLEPVAYDAMPFYTFISETSISRAFITTRIFNDSQIRTAYARSLERITHEEYIDALESELGTEHDRLRTALEVEFPEQSIPAYHALAVDWSQLRQRALALSLELQPAEVVRGSYQGVNLEPGASGSPALALDLVNLMILPVEVERVEINGQGYAIGGMPLVLSPVIDPKASSFEPVHLTIPLSERITLNPDSQVVVVVCIRGLEREFRATLSGASLPDGIQTGPAPELPTVEEALERYPFLQQNPGNAQMLLVFPGAWDVPGDLILPAGVDLAVPAGTVLRFSEKSILYANGAIQLMGTPDAPVQLTDQGAGWGGIVVINAGRDSQWTHAAVGKTTGIDRAGWTLTGGITFYRSNITLDHVLLGNNQTEDAINVIHSAFQFVDSEWENTQADAFDSDFSTGEVTGCYFHDVSGDAVDVSGTTAMVTSTRMERITDKGISAGEGSTLEVMGIHVDIAGIGVASKDLSRVTLRQSVISNARFSALAAYIKKPVYGPGWIDAQNITILNAEKAAVVQTGSTILLEGKKVDQVDLDVDLLYQEGILGN